jgi:hypothetical protein
MNSRWNTALRDWVFRWFDVLGLTFVGAPTIDAIAFHHQPSASEKVC